eukprot:XP_008178864.1 PREDICTED: uncharacterized protein LOC103308025 [Acyrthosiphon pisum]
MGPMFMPEPTKNIWEESARDPGYKFICVDVGGYGRNSDGGILEESTMGKRLETGTLNVPQNAPLPGQMEDTPMVLIGDEAFALKSYLMKPFPWRLSRSDTRVYKGPIEVKEQTTTKIVLATCILHNYLRVSNSDVDITSDEDESSAGFSQIEDNNRRGTNESLRIREKFKNGKRRMINNLLSRMN